MALAVASYSRKSDRQQQKEGPLDLLIKGLQVAGMATGIYENVQSGRARGVEMEQAQTLEKERLKENELAQRNEISPKALFETVQKGGVQLVGPEQAKAPGVLTKYVVGQGGAREPVYLKQALQAKQSFEAGESAADRAARLEAERIAAQTKENIARWNAQVKKEALEVSKKLKEQADKEAEVESKSTQFKALAPEDQISVKDLAKVRAARQAIRGEINANIVQWDKAKSDKERLQIGNQMIKTLNSTQGSDAVGAEEVKRLASNLEIVLFVNPNRPGEVGRNLEAFRRDVENTRDILSTSIDTVNKEIGAYYGRVPPPVQPTSTPIFQQTGQNPQTGRPILTPGQR